jgi:hypothetical protein
LLDGRPGVVLRAPIGAGSVCPRGAITPLSVSAATSGVAIAAYGWLSCPPPTPKTEFALRGDVLKLRLYANAEGVENALRGAARA